jgi:hypothetical protein
MSKVGIKRMHDDRLAAGLAQLQPTKCIKVMGGTAVVPPMIP